MMDSILEPSTIENHYQRHGAVPDLFGFCERSEFVVALFDQNSLYTDYPSWKNKRSAKAFVGGGPGTDTLPTFGIKHPKLMIDENVHSPIATNGTSHEHLNLMARGQEARKHIKSGSMRVTVLCRTLFSLTLLFEYFVYSARHSHLRFLARLPAAKIASFVKHLPHQHPGCYKLNPETQIATRISRTTTSTFQISYTP